MKVDEKLTEIDIERAVEIKKCPGCNSGIYADERICRFCGADLYTRVCPDCMKSIPGDEDPCHFCGRLEPAKPTHEHIPSPKANNTVDVAFLVIVLAVGLAMIIWPSVSQPDISTCEPDAEISCFFETSWGVSGGVYLIGLCMLSIGLSILPNYIRKK